MRAHVRQSSHPRALGRGLRRRRRPALRVVCLVAAVGWACLSPPESEARVNPLVIIERQLHKANMLIVLDTSGSMTGVPGGLFANRTEAGVDCDNGTNCRMGGVLGICTHVGQDLSVGRRLPDWLLPRRRHHPVQLHPRVPAASRTVLRAYQKLRRDHQNPDRHDNADRERHDDDDQDPHREQHGDDDQDPDRDRHDDDDQDPDRDHHARPPARRPRQP